jgi:hypothetical protein
MLKDLKWQNVNRVEWDYCSNRPIRYIGLLKYIFNYMKPSMLSIGWIGDAIKFLDFVNSPMGCKSVVRMLIVLNWGEPVYRIWICVSVWKSGGEPVLLKVAYFLKYHFNLTQLSYFTSILTKSTQRSGYPNYMPAFLRRPLSLLNAADS